MHPFRRQLPPVLALLPFVALPTPIRAQDAAAVRAPAALAIVDVRLFDGETVFPRATVLVENGTIAAVGADVAVPPGAEVVDGSGKTLLPGLIDAHSHVRPEGLARSLAFGVTTELDMFTDPAFAREMRAQQAAEDPRRVLEVCATGAPGPWSDCTAPPPKTASILLVSSRSSPDR